MRAAIFDTTIEQVQNMGIQETRNFKLAFKPGDHFDFEAGQFVNILVEKEPGKVIKRAYSIASSPRWEGFIELCWRRVQCGVLTNILWQYQPGDKVRIQGPLGHFTIKKPAPKQLILVSTGTGIAPFRSMIYSLLSQNADCEIWNIFGNRFVEDVLYKEEFEILAKAHSNLHNIFTVSRPEKDWHGEKGYVQAAVRKHIKATPESHVYICGLTHMIHETVNTCTELGFEKSQVHFEKYD